MFVVVPQFVSIGFCSMATDQLCCAVAGLVKTANTARAKASVSNFFKETPPSLKKG
jgi:hypothetical protein